MKTISTKGLSREAWLAIRMGGIGGSDAAAALGISPFTSPIRLWLEKTGAMEPEDLSDNSRVRAGNYLEPVVAQWYADENPAIKVQRRNAVLFCDEHPFMLANLDRVIKCPERGKGGLEIKAPDARSAPYWEEDVPDYYQIQVQHYMAVDPSLAFFDVAALIGGNDFRQFHIQRDPDLIAALIEGETRFWEMVQSGVMPQAIGSDDEAGCFRHLFPGTNAEVLDLSSTVAVDLASEYLAAKTERDAAEARRKKASSEIKTLMGQHVKGKAGEVSISWSRFKKRKTDLDGLRAHHPAIMAEHTTMVDDDRLTVTPPKPKK